MAITDSYGVALATKLQMELDQPTSEMMARLCNKDYEGDFFKIGDTVQLVKPDISAISVVFGSKDDTRPVAQEVDFDKSSFTIDKAAKYRILVSDINKAEGKWDYASLGLDLVAQKMRQGHNLEIANLIVNDANIPRLGTPAAPIEVTADELYSKIMVPVYTSMCSVGAITQDGTYSYGSNPEEVKRTNANMYVPAELFGQLLTCKYITDRATVKADGVIASASVKEILGFQIEIEPALSQASKRKVTVTGLAEGTFILVVGTQNLVTRANKVLTPDKKRSETRFADDYSGLELYGHRVASPESGMVAFVKIK